MVLKIDEKSSLQVEDFIWYLRSLIEKYGADCEVMGVLPVSLMNGANDNLANLEDAKKLFGEEYFFKTKVKYVERLKQFTVTGITDEDIHDKRIHESYKKTADEFVSHLTSELERRTIPMNDPDVQYPDNELKLEETGNGKSSVTVPKSTRYKINALVRLNKALTIAHLIDILLEEYINIKLTEDEKKKFDSHIDDMKQKDKNRGSS